MLYEKTTVEEDQNKYIRYASKISGNNLDFLAKLEGENGTWDPGRQSDYVYPNGVREDSWGFCQVHRPSHPEIVGDPRFFSDPYWQLDECLRLFLGGTPMYAVPKPGLFELREIAID